MQPNASKNFKERDKINRLTCKLIFVKIVNNKSDMFHGQGLDE